jgi:hypothetical protein
MITRKSLIALAVFVLVCFIVAGAIGNHRHGFVMAIGDIAWFGLIFGLLFLVIGSAMAIVRSRRQPDRG